MNEHIFAVLPRDEAKTFGIVKPLYCSLFHVFLCISLLLMLRRKIGRLPAEIARKQEGWLLDVPFVHTHKHYTSASNNFRIFAGFGGWPTWTTSARPLAWSPRCSISASTREVTKPFSALGGHSQQ